MPKPTIATQGRMQGLDMPHFLQTYWQKKPCVIKQFIPNFTDPIDEHELAGLAQEEEIDSRLVSLNNGDWQVTQGPIDDFAPLCVGAWTLLVQSVDRFIPGLNRLSDGVKRIGNWRMDDIMVSFSTNGAGVGPHIDQYDVFIVQGKGERRWQVGLPDEHETLLPHPLLKQISGFKPIIDEVLSRGDAIYIPPQHPHNGTALSECINYSIGFRAPTNLEILNGLLDEGDNLHLSELRYTDPDLDTYRAEELAAEAITAFELARLKQSIRALLDAPEANQALMRFVSRQGLLDMRPETDYSIEEIFATLQGPCELQRAPGLKAVYLDGQGDDFEFYIDATPFCVKQPLAESIKSLLNQDITLGPIKLNQEALSQYALVITQLLNEGYYDLAVDEHR